MTGTTASLVPGLRSNTRCESKKMGRRGQTSSSLPTEPVYAIDGTPRWETEPDVVVNPLRGADDNDPFIAAAIEQLQPGK